jgi:putative mRNA 3-end processing factor
MMFEVNNSKRFLFTGDINTADTHLVKGAKAKKCDVLCIEGTYAGRDHPKKREEIEKELIDNIEDVIHQGGMAILPAFAVARAQEIALVLRKTGFNIWFDGMGRKVSKIFLKHPKYLRSQQKLKQALNHINFVHSDHGRKLALDGDVILTSSGMMDGGPVLHYMHKIKNDPKSAVFLTGYQVEGTNSRLLMDEKKLNFYGVLENVSCQVSYYDFSGHAGHSELIDFSKQCGPEKIILMHSDNRDALNEPLGEFSEVISPSNGELISI